MRLIIITAIIFCPKLLLLGLHQFIYNLTILLRLKDVLAAPSIFSKDGGIKLNII